MSIERKADPIVGSSSLTAELKSLLGKFAVADAPVLVLGESGVGKELICKEVHRLSGRTGQLVFINCGAIPDQLLESEIFGHVKGAFTGATCDRKGKFQLADEGTLVLDEIGDMPLDLQVKLLRVMEEQKVQPVGGNDLLETNVRLVAATNKNLEEMVKEGRFREDLFHRLNVLPVRVPPLRERAEDIDKLVLHFLSVQSKAKSKTFSISKKSLSAMLAYDWPGNVRELSNFVQRITVLTSGSVIRFSDIPEQFLPLPIAHLYAENGIEEDLSEDVSGEDIGSEGEGGIGEFFDYEQIVELSEVRPLIPAEGIDAPNVLNNIERNLVIAALDRCGWNVSKSAQILGMPRTTLIQKMNKFSLNQKLEE